MITRTCHLLAPRSEKVTTNQRRLATRLMRGYDLVGLPEGRRSAERAELVWMQYLVSVNAFSFPAELRTSVVGRS